MSPFRYAASQTGLHSICIPPDNAKKGQSALSTFCAAKVLIFFEIHNT